MLALVGITVRISTHALLAEGDPEPETGDTETPISTHALLAEGDVWVCSFGDIGNISTHALLAEGYAAGGVSQRLSNYFNPRPPCGGRP